MTERDSGVDAAEALTGPVLRQIGHHLRLAREERGETLQDIAQFLRIRRAYLQDLENGDLSAIPGRAYALGFLRSYGDYLGFNGDAIVTEVKRTDEPLPESPTLQVREPLPESHRPPLVLVGVSLLLAALVYVGWNYWQDFRTAPDEIAATDRPPRPEPAAAADDAGAPATATDDAAAATAGDDAVRRAATRDGTGSGEAAVGPRADATADLAAAAGEVPPLPAVPEPPMPASVDALSGETEVTAAETTAEGDAMVAAILEQPDPEAATADAPEAATAAIDASEGEAAGEAEPVDLLQVVAAQSGAADVRTFGDAEAGGRVVLVASGRSWVQVKSASSDYVWTRTLEPGDAYFVPDVADLALWTGNAGGLKVLVDGEPLPSLGEQGQVRRDIPLAADALSAQYAAD